MEDPICYDDVLNWYPASRTLTRQQYTFNNSLKCHHVVNLAQVLGNRFRGPNLTPDERQRIIAKRQCECTIPELVEEFSRSESTIKYTIRTYTKATATQMKSQSKRPPILSTRTKKLIYRKARSTPKVNYAELAEVAQIYAPDDTPSKPPSKSALHRALKKAALINHRCKAPPKLTHARAGKRVRFSRKYQHHNWLQRSVKFPNECSVQNGAGHTQKWCFQYPDGKWDHKIVVEILIDGQPA
jgi:hypothetical protein